MPRLITPLLSNSIMLSSINSTCQDSYTFKLIIVLKTFQIDAGRIPSMERDGRGEPNYREEGLSLLVDLCTRFFFFFNITRSSPGKVRGSVKSCHGIQRCSVHRNARATGRYSAISQETLTGKILRPP
jgi:hypothetical protein